MPYQVNGNMIHSSTCGIGQGQEYGTFIEAYKAATIYPDWCGVSDDCQAIRHLISERRRLVSSDLGAVVTQHKDVLSETEIQAIRSLRKLISGD